MDEQMTEALVAIAFTTGHKSYSRGAIARFPADKFAELKAQGFVTEAPAPEPEEESGRPPFGGGDASANVGQTDAAPRNSGSGGAAMPGGLASAGEAAPPPPVSGGKRR